MEQTSINESKKIMCKYCGIISIHFDPTKKSKSQKLLPLEESGNVHECAMSPWNQKQKQAPTVATADKLVSIREVEFNLLSQKLDLVTKQMSALLQKYNVTIDNLTPVEH